MHAAILISDLPEPASRSKLLADFGVLIFARAFLDVLRMLGRKRRERRVQREEIRAEAQSLELGATIVRITSSAEAATIATIIQVLNAQS